MDFIRLEEVKAYIRLQSIFRVFCDQISFKNFLFSNYMSIKPVENSKNKLKFHNMNCLIQTLVLP